MSAYVLALEEINAALLDVSNTVEDLLRADYGTYQRTIPKLSRVLNSPPLGHLVGSLKSRVNLNKWIDDGKATQSSFAGSGRLLIFH